MKIPFLDLKAQYNTINNKIDKKLKEVINNTAFVSGKYVEEFEDSFANFCETKYCVGLNSGTSALHAALLAHGIKSGDEIITVPNSFIATTWAISYCGAKPVFVDVDPKTFLIDHNLIESKITSKTRAILPVHLYGQHLEIDLINEIANKYNLSIIEDAAQAHASKYKGKSIGSYGNTTCFSFYPGKNLGAYGEGGAVVSDDIEIINYIKMLRDHGQSKKYKHNFLGYNYRMDGFQGAVLNIKLNYLQDWTDKRNRIAKKYSDGLQNIKNLQIPCIQNNSISAFHLYVIHTKKREQLAEYLEEHGIMTGMHYPIPIHLQKAYSYLGYKKGDFVNSEKNAKECLSLPMYPEMTDLQIDRVIKIVVSFFNK